jgi:hypothetical protein
MGKNEADAFDDLVKRIPQVLTSDVPSTEYGVGRPEKSLSTHRGQRKLMISEIQFLTSYGHLSGLVVYAGSAPGSHIPYLSKMFPNHKFILIDPHFDENVDKRVKGENIKTVRSFFNDELALQLDGKGVLFISDIRTSSATMPYLEVEKRITNDNMSQMRWVELMHPVASMLKFRCHYPYESNVRPEDSRLYYPNTLMFKGECRLQAWGPRTTTETRLVVHEPYSLQEYDNVEYQNRMAYVNHTLRETTEFSNPVVIAEKTHPDDLRNNYDSCLEVIVLGQYLRHVQNIFTKQLKGSFFDQIRFLSKGISDQLHYEHIHINNPQKKERRADDDFPALEKTMLSEKLSTTW